MLLEICVDSVESALAAERGGAQRLELCSDLLEGGITPGPGLMESVRSSIGLEVFLMVRPRGGDFFYTAQEFECMKADIRHARAMGMDGIVLGILDADGRVDVERTAELIDLAHPLPVTFHRAIDVSADFEESLDRVIASGAQRVLTSGGKSSALDGVKILSSAVKRTAGQITIMVGGGLKAEDLPGIAQQTGAREFHAGLKARMPSPTRYRKEAFYLGASLERDYSRYGVREQDVRRLRETLDLYENGSLPVAQASGAS